MKKLIPLVMVLAAVGLCWMTLGGTPEPWVAAAGAPSAGCKGSDTHGARLGSWSFAVVPLEGVALKESFIFEDLSELKTSLFDASSEVCTIDSDGSLNFFFSRSDIGDKGGSVRLFGKLVEDKAEAFYALINFDCPGIVYANGVAIAELANRGQIAGPQIVRFTVQNDVCNILISLTADAGRNVEGRFEICSSLESALEKLISYSGSIFNRSVIDSWDQLELSINGNFGVLFDCTATHVPSEAKYNCRLAIGCPVDLDTDERGIYSFEMTIGGKRYRETLFFGDPMELDQSKLPFLADPTVLFNRKRLDVLLRHENVRIGNRNWELKFVSALNACFGGRAKVAGDQIDNLSDRIKLFGFKSGIDGAILGFRVFIPARLSGLAPAMVMLPPALENVRPFAESAIIAEHESIFGLCRAAEELGFILIWPGYRTVPSGAVQELAHIYEVLDEVALLAPIDERRVSLLGKCAAGITAGLLMNDSPNRFCSATFIKAYFGQERLVNLSPVFDRFQDLDCYLQNTNPEKLLTISRPSRSPFLIVHDGSSTPGHGEVVESEKFVAQAIADDWKVSYWRNEPEVISSRFLKRIFSWAMPHRVKAFDKQRGKLYERVTEVGPIQRGFEGPCVIVKGTRGNAKVNAAIEDLAGRLCKEWEKENFNLIEVVSDWEIAEDDIRSRNVVLLGDSVSNALWSKLVPNNFIEIDSDTCRVGRRVFEGDALCVQAASINPLNSNRVVIAVGASKPSGFLSCPACMFRDGWYDYAVWNAYELKAAGYYGSDTSLTGEDRFKMMLKNAARLRLVDFF